MRFPILLAAAALSLALAQPPTAPVIAPRGLVNAFSRQPAPSTVGRGGLLEINGFNLGPPQGIAASTPAPLKLGDVEVLLNNTPIPVLSARPDKILAQVPLDALLGPADVQVRRGGQTSRPARSTILNFDPAVRSASDSGFGPAAGETQGPSLRLQASGLGLTDPRVEAGDLPAGDTLAQPVIPVVAYVGGHRANASAALSSKNPGQFDVQLELPPQSRAGDVIRLLAGPPNNLRPANNTVFRSLRAPDVQFLALPDGAREIRSLTNADLNGNFVAAATARSADGCYAAYLFDFVRKTAAPAADCLTTANANAVSPVVETIESNALAAFLGPPPADAQPGAAISSKVRILNPALDGALDVDLPAPAANLLGFGGGLLAQVPGAPPQFLPIDIETGEVREPVSGFPIGPGGPGAGAGAGGLLLNLNLDVDGLKSALSPPSPLPQNRFGILVGDDANQPSRARFAILAAQPAGIAVVSSQEFPAGWMPLLAAQAPNRPGFPGGPGGAGGPAGGPAPNFQIPRGALYFDAQRRIAYAAATSLSQHALIAFPLDDAGPTVLPLPEGRFIASCAVQIRFQTLDLSRSVILAGSTATDGEFRSPCPAYGFLQLDLNTQQITFVAVQGEGGFDASPGSSGEFNDYAYGANTSAPPQARADTLDVLDGVSGSAFRLSLPQGVGSFQNLQPVPALNSLIGLATNRLPGDAGFVVFDLDRGETRLLNTPEGYASVTLLGVFLATRKLVARGVAANSDGANLLIYDLATQDLTIVPNPDGIAFFGPAAPAAPPGPAPGQPPQRLLLANPKANTAAGIALDSSRRQKGVLVLRIP